MRKTFARAGDLWFAPAPAERLGLLRVAVAAYSLWYLRSRVRMFGRIARTDPKLFRPVGPVRVLDKPLRPRTADMLTLATVGAEGAFLVGWRHRYAGPACASLLLWTLSYRNSWSMIYHSDNLLVLHTLVLGASRSADAYSFDALKYGSLGSPTSHGRYGWPLRLMNAVTASAYLLSGVAKVKGSLGWGWADGKALRSQVAIDGLRKTVLGGAASPIAARLNSRVALYRVMAVASLAAELSAPFVLLDKRLTRLWAICTFGMHWGIYAVMGIKFRYQQSGVLFAPAFEIERLPALLGRVVGAQA